MTKSPQQKPKRRYLQRSLRFIASLLALTVLLLLVGYIIQQVGVKNDQATYPPLGQMIDLNGNKTHLWCLGEAQPGQSTVIVEAGIGRTSLDWAHILPLIAPTTQICAYDRLGYGWSSPASTPRSLENLSQELNAVLSKANITAPLLLVGHSYGGAVARQYTSQYPQDVAGLILVDAMHEREWVNATPEEQQYVAQQQGQLMVITFLNRFGLLRMFGRLLGTEALPVPVTLLEPEHQAAYRAFLLHPTYYETWLQEIQALPGTTLPPELPNDLPLIVITAEQPAATSDAEQLHAELQKALLTLSANSKQVMADSGHDIPLQHPEIVVNAIQEMLQK